MIFQTRSKADRLYLGKNMIQIAAALCGMTLERIIPVSICADTAMPITIPEP